MKGGKTMITIFAAGAAALAVGMLAGLTVHIMFF